MDNGVFHFRVLLDHTEEVFRDFEIKSSSSFEELHEAIVGAFGFSGQEIASFYMSNEEWDKGEEITQMDMGGLGEAGIKTMKDTLISDMIFDKEDKLLYVYDFMRMWVFYVEVISIREIDSSAEYPKVILSVGDAPDESSKELIDSFPVDFNLDMEEFSGQGEGFENIDDYDEIL